MKKYLLVLVGLVGLLGVAPRALTQTQDWPLLVNGSPELRMNYTGGTLTVQFRRTLRGAGKPETYIKNVPEGAGSWLDRPVARTEPLMLKQTMTPAMADAAIARLRQGGGYWMFYCHNTGRGYYEVSKSQRADATVRFD